MAAVDLKTLSLILNDFQKSSSNYSPLNGSRFKSTLDKFLKNPDIFLAEKKTALDDIFPKILKSFLKDFQIPSNHQTEFLNLLKVIVNTLSIALAHNLQPYLKKLIKFFDSNAKIYKKNLRFQISSFETAFPPGEPRSQYWEEVVNHFLKEVYPNSSEVIRQGKANFEQIRSFLTILSNASPLIQLHQREELYGIYFHP
jgi:hypothetical protein